MITIISGTNRKENHSLILAQHAEQTLKKEGTRNVNLLDLQILEGPLLLNGSYTPEDQSDQIRLIQDSLVVPANKFYFIVPEYNGSFPGILKYFLDACSVRDIKQTFSGKKAAILGVSTGRAGNLRGMDHLTGILNYLNVNVMPNRLPVSQVSGLIDMDQLDDEHTRQLVAAHVREFLQF